MFGAKSKKYGFVCKQFFISVFSGWNEVFSPEELRTKNVIALKYSIYYKYVQYITVQIPQPCFWNQPTLSCTLKAAFVR